MANQTLKEISTEIKMAPTDALRTAAVKKLYQYINSEELYDRYAQVIQLQFDFIDSSDDPDLVIESLYFLVEAYRLPHQELVALTTAERFFQKLQKTVENPVFEARVLNFRTGLEVFCLLFVLISELAYFPNDFLSSGLLAFIQRYTAFENSKIRRYSRSALCGILEFREEYDAPLNSAVYVFISVNEEEAVLIAATQALVAHSVLVDFQFPLPFEPLLDTLVGLSFTDETSGRQRIQEDILKLLLNISTSESNLQRMCESSLIFAVTEVFDSLAAVEHGQKVILCILANIASVEPGAQLISENRQTVSILVSSLANPELVADSVDIFGSLFFHNQLSLTRDIAKALSLIEDDSLGFRLSAIYRLIEDTDPTSTEILQAFL